MSLSLIRWGLTLKERENGMYQSPFALRFWGRDLAPTLKTLNHYTCASLSVYPSEEAACPAKRKGEKTELGQNFRP